MDRRVIWWISGAAVLAFAIYNHKSITDMATISTDDALNDKNVQAFLRAIRAGESNQTPQAYNMLVYGGTFSDMSTHPHIFKVNPNNGTKTSAAGAYQITYTTWLWLHVLAGVDDFTPESQDRMAVAYLKKKGALSDVIAGNFADAMNSVSDVWESITIPSLYNRMQTAYLNYGGTFA